MSRHAFITPTSLFLTPAASPSPGWYDVGWRNPLIKTPTLDELVAKESAVLTRHYVFKFCSPTRRSLLSGRYPTHSGTDNGGDATMDLRFTSLATKLKSLGYATHQSGKWHAGHYIMEQTPHGRGFDTSLGYFQGMEDHWNQRFQECNHSTDLWDTDKPGFGMNGTYGDYLYAARAVSVIQAHVATTPLFYYLAMQCAHDPMQVPDRFAALYDKETCADVDEYAFSSVIDEVISNVTAALRKKDMWANTLMVFSADNGGPAFSDQQAASNYPLRGGKYQLWEGGIRATAFVSGGLLPSKMRGTNITSLMHICDWWVTFAKLAGGVATDGDGSVVPKLDGLDQWPIISGASTAVVRSEVFPAKGVLIQEQWKLVVGGVGGTAMWSGQHYPKVPATGPKNLDCGAGCLFDVVSDPEERLNLNGSAAHAGTVAKMQARLAALELTIWQANPKQTNTTIQQVCAMTLAQGEWLTPADWHPHWARKA